MSETLTISVFAALAVMGAAIKYLHRQNTTLYIKMMENQGDHAKCMEQHGRTEERSIYLGEEVAELRLELKAIRETQKAVAAQLPNPVPLPSFAKDTELGK